MAKGAQQKHLETPVEVVHHVDGDRANNELSNLELMSRADHAALHQNSAGGC